MVHPEITAALARERQNSLLRGSAGHRPAGRPGWRRGGPRRGLVSVLRARHRARVSAGSLRGDASLR